MLFLLSNLNLEFRHFQQFNVKVCCQSGGKVPFKVATILNHIPQVFHFVMTYFGSVTADVKAKFAVIELRVKLYNDWGKKPNLIISCWLDSQSLCLAYYELLIFFFKES